MYSRVVLVGVCTKETKTSREFVQMCNQHYHKPILLGQGMVWTGFNLKIKLILDFLKSIPINERYSTLVAVVDVYDLLVQAPQQEFIYLFNEYSQNIIVGCEYQCNVNCFNNNCNITDDNGKNMFVNGGFVLGTIDHLIELYAYIFKNFSYDDQIGISHYMNEDCNKVHLDTNQSFCLNIYNLNDAFFSDAYVLNKHGKKPLCVHVPFIHKDLGCRNEKIRRLVVPNYIPVPKYTHFYDLLVHVYKHGTTNKVYFPIFKYILLFFCILFAIVVFLCFLNHYT